MEAGLRRANRARADHVSLSVTTRYPTRGRCTDTDKELTEGDTRVTSPAVSIQREYPG